MESTNLHQLQDHSPAVQTSSLSTLSCFGVGTTHSWTPNITLNGGNLNPNFQEVNPSPRSRALKDSMIQAGLGYEWASVGAAAGSCLSSECDDEHLDLPYNSYSKIKEEISDAFPSKFTEMLNTTSGMDHKDFNAFSDKLLLKSTLSSGDLYSTTTASQNFASFGGTGMGMGGLPSRGSFTQIYPTINISNLNQSASPPAIMSSSFDINMQCSDLLTSSTFNGAFTRPSQDALVPGFTDDLSFRRLHHMQQPIHRSSCNFSNPSHFTNGMAETKRPNTLVESKASQSQTVPKKSRLESRSSCPPFKVRKEKLGDRIAALQQLVAPFGKTDTASVLMEAIGYIKFLQNQVETLSVPYMRSSRKQTNRPMQRVSGREEAKEEPKLDLRSRGLCLVPLSCMSYFAGDGGTGVWQQSDFGGAT